MNRDAKGPSVLGPMPVVVTEDAIKGLFGGSHDTLGGVFLVKEKLCC